MSDASQPGRVLVIGSQGVLGGLCVEALREAGMDVIRGGRREEEAADFRRVDLDDADTVAAACSDVDLVVSTVRHPGQTAERHILTEGGVLLNVATLWSSERESLRSHAADARGLVVLDAGLAPGVTSLVLKDMLASHPEADSIEAEATFSALEPSGRATAIDFLHPALSSRARHETRTVEFPSPIGWRRCLRLSGPDVDTMLFGGLRDGRKTDAWGCMLERAVNADFLVLNSVGLLSKMPVGFFTLGSTWKMKRRAHKPQAHIVGVSRNGTRLAAGVVLLGVIQVDIPLINEYTLGILLVLGGIAAIVLTMTLGRRGTTTTRVVERPAVSEPRVVERQIIERDVNDPNLP